MTTPADPFAGLGLDDDVLATLAQLGYEEPTPVQRAAIPALLSGRDTIGQAATGTGKTAAFALPIVQRLVPGPRDPRPSALVLVPTRELCVQVSQAIHRYGRARAVRTLPIYGGQPYGRQLRELRDGVDVVVATPGRALDHVTRGTLDLTGVGVVVLDEADEMLDMGFAEDLEALLAATPTGSQTVLFSATLPARITGLAGRHLRDPLRIEIAVPASAGGPAPTVRQVAYVVARAYKTAALGRILDIEAPDAALVFCRTREEVDNLTEAMNGRGYRAEALHGGMDQAQRERVLGRLRSGAADLVVATDVAARGLDVEHLTHVVNVDVPSASESYVHRIGRVGRAGRPGVAITLAEPREHRMLEVIERQTGNRIRVERIPTVADLRARRLELTRAALAEALAGGDLDSYRVVLDSLTEDHDLVEVALAAVRLAHETLSAGGPGAVAGAADAEIPDAALPVADPRRKGKKASRAERPGRVEESERRPRSGKHGGKHGGKRPGADGSGTSRVQVNLGRQAGIRPQDLVGAVANEAGLRGGDVGAIEIADRYSVVEVPRDAAVRVAEALGGTRIRGRRAKARVLA